MSIIEILNTDICPVIKEGTKVVVEHIFEFPASGKKFVTIRDVANVPLNRHGQPEPIISTIPYEELTFQPYWIPRG